MKNTDTGSQINTTTTGLIWVKNSKKSDLNNRMGVELWSTGKWLMLYVSEGAVCYFLDSPDIQGWATGVEPATT